MWKHMTMSYTSTSKSLDLENRLYGQASKQGNTNFEN